MYMYKVEKVGLFCLLSSNGMQNKTQQNDYYIVNSLGLAFGFL